MGNLAGQNGNETHHESPIDSQAAAAYLNIHYKTLERMARFGEVPATKSGRSWQYLRSLLRDWLQARMNSNVRNNNPSTNKKENDKR
jgi:excisionase family DNA binding protein